MDQFVSIKYPALLREFNAIHMERRLTEDNLTQMERLVQQPITHTDIMNQHFQTLSTLERASFNEMDQWKAEWEESCLPSYQDLSTQLEEIKTDISYQISERETICQQWSELRGKVYFKKGKLKRLAQSQMLFNENIGIIQRKNSYLLNRESTIKLQLQTLFQKMTEYMSFLHQQLIEEAVQMELQWEEGWGAQNKELVKISSDKLIIAQDIQFIREEFSRTIGSFYKENFPLIEPIYAYQETKYLSDTIENMIPNLPIDEFNRAKTTFDSMQKLKPMNLSNNWNGHFDYDSLFNHNLPPIPLPLTFPIEQEIEHIVSRRKKVLGGLMAASVVCIIATQIDFASITDEFLGARDENNLYEEYDQGSETTVEPVAQMEPVIQEEQTLDFSQWDENSIREFIGSLHERINQKQYNEVASTFTAHGMVHL